MRPAISSPEAGAGALTVLGVRHHSPACAAMVRDAILGLKPATVLIEGPADFNPHPGDLALDHRLPVAIFSFHATSRRSRLLRALLRDLAGTVGARGRRERAFLRPAVLPSGVRRPLEPLRRSAHGARGAGGSASLACTVERGGEGWGDIITIPLMQSPSGGQEAGQG